MCVRCCCWWRWCPPILHDQRRLSSCKERSPGSRGSRVQDRPSPLGNPRRRTAAFVGTLWSWRRHLVCCRYGFCLGEVWVWFLSMQIFTSQSKRLMAMKAVFIIYLNLKFRWMIGIWNASELEAKHAVHYASIDHFLDGEIICTGKNETCQLSWIDMKCQCTWCGKYSVTVDNYLMKSEFILFELW